MKNMSHRPKRRATFKQSYNEEYLFMDNVSVAYQIITYRLCTRKPLKDRLNNLMRSS